MDFSTFDFSTFPQPPFAKWLGVEIISADKTMVRGQLLVRPELCSPAHRLHGGAVMALADTLGATGAALHLPEGAGGTMTLESKTNFIGAAPEGTVIVAEATPLHIGRRTSVWQTRILSADGKLVALVTQTQLVL